MSDKRICIKCESEMLPEMVQEVEVDVCAGCGGMWLDRDEIRELSAKSDAELAKLRKILDETEPERQVSDAEVAKPCPACSGKLTVANLGPVYVEHCSGCDGLYLDKGELDKCIDVLQVRGEDVATIVALAQHVVTSGTIGD